jgi:hypothetical protein
MHEVINQTIKEVRENSKFASTMRHDLEKFYKELRSDITDVVSVKKIESSSSNEEGEIIDGSKLNDLINEALMKKK